MKRARLHTRKSRADVMVAPVTNNNWDCAKYTQFTTTCVCISRMLRPNRADISLSTCIQMRETQSDNSSDAHGSRCDYVSFKIISRNIIAGTVRADKRASNRRALRIRTPTDLSMSAATRQSAYLEKNCSRLCQANIYSRHRVIHTYMIKIISPM